MIIKANLKLVNYRLLSFQDRFVSKKLDINKRKKK